MADVTFEGASDFDRVKRDFDGLVRDMVKIREENKRLNEESKRGSRERSEAVKLEKGSIEELGRAWGDNLRSVMNVRAAVGLVFDEVKKQYEEFKSYRKELAGKNADFRQTLTGDVLSSGDFAAAGTIEEWARTRRGANREDARRAFAGVSGANPNASLDDRFDLADAVSRAAPITRDAQVLGNLAGQLQQILPKKPGRTLDDVADLALSLSQRAGNNAQMLGSPVFAQGVDKLVRSGVDEHLALGMGLTAVKNNTSPQVLDTIAAKLNESIDTRSLAGQAPTPENVALLKVARTAPGSKERLDLLLGGDDALLRGVYGPGMSEQMKLISRGAAEREAAGLRQDEQADFIGRSREAFARTPLGARHLGAYDTGLDAERSDAARGTAVAAAQEEELMKRLTAENAGFLGSWQARENLTKAQSLRKAGLTPPGATPADDVDVALRAAGFSGMSREERQQFDAGVGRESGREQLRPFTQAEQGLKEQMEKNGQTELEILRALERLGRQPAVEQVGPPER